MKVLLLGNSTWCLYNFRQNLIRTLVAEGHSVSVMAPFDPTFQNKAYVRRLRRLHTSFYAVPLRPRNLNPLLELWAVIAMFWQLRRAQPDVVLTFTVKCNLYAALCRKLLRFRQIANIPGLGEAFERRSQVQRIVCMLYKYCFRGVETALFQNQQDLVHCQTHRLVPGVECRLLPGSGVDLEQFSVNLPPRSKRRFVFLMFGRLLPQKGFHHFMSAAEIVAAQCKGRSLRPEFWVMGIEDKNRAESQELAAAVRESASLGIIRHLPTTVDVAPILAEADVVVLPSWYNEGVPRSLLEAMACGKPILTTEWKGCRETVEGGRNGLLVPVKDVQSLARAMLQFVEMESTKLRSMGIFSRQLAENRFDERLVIAAYMSRIYGTEVPLESLNQPLERSLSVSGSAGH